MLLIHFRCYFPSVHKFKLLHLVISKKSTLKNFVIDATCWAHNYFYIYLSEVHIFSTLRYDIHETRNAGEFRLIFCYLKITKVAAQSFNHSEKHTQAHSLINEMKGAWNCCNFLENSRTSPPWWWFASVYTKSICIRFMHWKIIWCVHWIAYDRNDGEGNI